MHHAHTFTAFQGFRRLAGGPLEAMLPELLRALGGADPAGVLIFDDGTGAQVDFDLRGDAEAVVARALPTPKSVGPGRPKLGVQGREVSLLPRHWEWLETQPNGISAALRRLVEEAMKREPEKDRARRARDAASRVMTSLAGDLPGYEEASRALFADDPDGFSAQIAHWPADVREHLLRVRNGHGAP